MWIGDVVSGRQFKPKVNKQEVVKNFPVENFPVPKTGSLDTTDISLKILPP